MAAKVVSQGATETDLEVRISAALTKALWWLPSDSLRHQTKLRFKLGHAQIEVNGVAKEKAEGRADVLVLHNDKALAVFELKRPGLPLTEADSEQALSYARVLHPRPPLVVLSNGTDTEIYATHTGKPWEPETPNEEQLAQLIAAANQVSVTGLKNALDVLLNPAGDLWPQAISAATGAMIAENTGGWADDELPFAKDFLIPRNATTETIQYLDKKSRIVIIAGKPMSGKSSVLRDLIARNKTEQRAVLLVDADSVRSQGLIRHITNTFASALSWVVTPDEVRDWLRKLSRGTGACLVIAVDGLSDNSDQLRGDIEELSEDAFGTKLQLILTMDDTTVKSFTIRDNGRNESRIGHRAKLVFVDALDDEEFDKAEDVLGKQRIGFMSGAAYATEYRAPWLLRSLAGGFSRDKEYVEQGLSAALPPMLSLGIIQAARDHFEGKDELGRQFGQIAKAILDDHTQGRPGPSLQLESSQNFVVRREAFLRHLPSEELRELQRTGFVRHWRTPEGESVIVPRLPELLAAELARQIGSHLNQKIEAVGPIKAADWLVETTGRVSMGDVLGAQAIYDAAEMAGSLPFEIVTQLLSARPREETPKPGTRALAKIPGAGVVELRFGEKGAIFAKVGNQVHELENDESPGVFYADMGSWLILSHFAMNPVEVRPTSGETGARLDPMVLMEVGSSPILLRRPGNDMEGVLVHDIPGHGSIACYKRGIVEPITWAIHRFFMHDGERTEDWIDEAIDRKSVPLLSRIDIALREVVPTTSPWRNWASATRKNRLAPALKDFPALSH